jgi:hypothetical protein
MIKQSIFNPQKGTYFVSEMTATFCTIQSPSAEEVLLLDFKG